MTRRLLVAYVRALPAASRATFYPAAMGAGALLAFTLHTAGVVL